MPDVSGAGSALVAELRVAADAWVAPGAWLLGRVTVESGASIWYTSVLRGDIEPITIGAGSNVQDGVVAHTDAGFPVRLGRNVSVGHRAVLHGCTVEDDVLIGMGSIVMNGAHVGAGSIVAAGALVTEGTRVPPGSLVAGLPAKIRRATTEGERSGVRENAALYSRLAVAHRGATR